MHTCQIYCEAILKCLLPLDIDISADIVCPSVPSVNAIQNCTTRTSPFNAALLLRSSAVSTCTEFFFLARGHGINEPELSWNRWCWHWNAFLLILPMSFGQEKQTVSFNEMISAFFSEILHQICSLLISALPIITCLSSYWKENLWLGRVYGGKKGLTCFICPCIHVSVMMTKWNVNWWLAEMVAVN